MFYIDQSTPVFQRAKQEHYKNVRYIIKKKLLGKKFTEPHPKGLGQRITQVSGIDSRIATFLNDESNLKNILIGTPDILDTIKKKFTSKKTITSVKSLIRYDAFIGKSVDNTFRFYNAYHLAENLSQQTCVYCNRLYTHTIINNKEFIARPAFDHWFPKGEFPLLALSFYNLIPSCTVCNSSIKGTGTYSIADNFHPYLKHPQSHLQFKFKFSFDLENHIHAQSKIIPENKFSRRSIKAMKLEEMYSLHTEEIRELIYLKKAYSQSYLNSLRSVLKSSISNTEMYRLAFAVYFEDTHLHKRPLSKLKKDILSELGLIK